MFLALCSLVGAARRSGGVMARRILPKLPFLALVVLSMGPFEAGEAGINCARVSKCPEKVICDTPQLMQLDGRLNALYDRMMAHLNRRDGLALQNSELEWLGQVHSCACGANCLVSMYELVLSCSSSGWERERRHPLAAAAIRA